MIVVIGITAGLLVGVGLIRLLENRFIYFPPREPEGPTTPATFGVPAEEVWITTEDGVRLNAWFWPSATSSDVLLWFHGNAESISYAVPRLKDLARLGLNILALDYRGYGKSQGSPNEEGIYRDAEAAYRYLVEARHVGPRHIFVYGHSLGGAAAIDLASRRECGGLIVESSFTRARDMAQRMLLIPLLAYVPKTRFDSLAKIARVRAPVLIAHGTRDSVVPLWMGKSLFQAAPEPKTWLVINGAGHDDLPEVGGEEYLESLRKFIKAPIAVPATSKSGRAGC